MFFLIPAALLIAAAFLVPLRKNVPSPKRRNGRFDERDISFARCRLQEGTPEYRDYYSSHPELEETDRRIRKLPGLLSQSSLYHDDMDSAAAEASFFLCHCLRNSVDGKRTSDGKRSDPERTAAYLRNWLRHMGADAVGTGRIPADIWYTNVGRGTGTYGERIEPVHEFAVVIGYEMKPELTSAAPESPEVVEVGIRYADCAAAAVKAAWFLTTLGYSARAHIDGNYRIAVAEAAMATGIGSFGWNGLLLTEQQGPRMRYAAVTTDMPLRKQSGQQRDWLPFCNLCRKCAGNCPSRSISMETPCDVNTDRCFAYWNAAGTDCGVCMAVCPIGHRWGKFKILALRSALAARLLLFLDDIFYGEKHQPGEGTVPWKR